LLRGVGRGGSRLGGVRVGWGVGVQAGGRVVVGGGWRG